MAGCGLDVPDLQQFFSRGGVHAQSKAAARPQRKKRDLESRRRSTWSPPASFRPTREDVRIVFWPSQSFARTVAGVAYAGQTAGALIAHLHIFRDVLAVIAHGAAFSANGFFVFATSHRRSSGFARFGP
jgi:hypothetical protein